jgi:hypothetical protein
VITGKRMLPYSRFASSDSSLALRANKPEIAEDERRTNLHCGAFTPPS